MWRVRRRSLLGLGKQCEFLGVGPAPFWFSLCFLQVEQRTGAQQRACRCVESMHGSPRARSGGRRSARAHAVTS